MTKIRMIVVAALLASTAAGCIVRTARPCRTECWWSHGQRVCEKRCN
jgi:hypothetical protein